MQKLITQTNNSRARQRFKILTTMWKKGYGKLFNDDKKLQWYHTIDIKTNKLIPANKTRFLKTDMVARKLMTLEEW